MTIRRRGLVGSTQCVAFAAIIWLGCGRAASLAQTTSGPGEFREFKDQRGRALQARVLRVSGDEVTVERKDGRQFTVPVSAFSAADQEYLRAPAAGPAPVAVDADWPRFRGPHGNGLSDEKLELLADGPKKLWQVTVAGGRGSPVVVSGKVYIAGNDNQGMTVTCLDAEQGKDLWTTRSKKEGGFALLADEKLIYLTGDGLLIIADPTPDGLTPIVEAQLLEGTTWGPPALCTGKVYVRNESGDLACWQIAAVK